jgi:anti-sigma regulatory factor (Ser/Thr protein kinase)
VISGNDVRRAQSFPLDVRSVAAARRFCAQTLGGSAPEVIEAAELMVSELATNSIRHVRSGFDLTIERTATQIRVEVRDFGGGVPELQLPGPNDLRGRGLQIVEMLAHSWGFTAASAEDKTVWFTLAIPRRKPLGLSRARAPPASAPTTSPLSDVGSAGRPVRAADIKT